MIFSSTIFLFAFCPVFFLIFFCLSKSIKAQNIWIIIGSLFFYAWGAGSFFFVVLGTLLIDYGLGALIYRDRSHAKLFVTLDVVMNLGILFYFKYFNFFVENINALFIKLGGNPRIFTTVLLPLGISFVVFQKMTYCLDIAKGTSAPAKSYFYLVEYLLLFPQIIAGPIVKYSEISEQIKWRSFSRDMFLNGFRRFSIGLFKKVWIADVVARTADAVFNAQSYGTVPIDYAWMGLIAYTFQIFFDFSAYSDMAIGMLSIMGFQIPENFNHPYASLSISEFWKRWHISMTSWFREYLYFPLGGNRVGKFRTYLNQWIVFLTSGFWHGAAWNFLFWGAYHGTLLCVERAFLLKRSQKLPRFIRWGVTFFLIMIGWVFFRADSIHLAFSYIGNLFNFSSWYTHINPSFILTIDRREWFVFALACIISFLPLLKRTCSWLTAQASTHPQLYSAGVLGLFILSALKVITGANSPFIYFRF